MADTNIEWTQRPGTIGAVWNPTTGCDKISDGCTNCYALTMAKRLKAMGQDKYQNDGHPVTSGPGFAVTVHSDELGTPLKWRKPRTVFVNSMSDLFHARVPRSFVARVFAVMAATPQHTYQILSKRPERMQRLIGEEIDGGGQALLEAAEANGFTTVANTLYEATWPLPNVWLGTSIESDEHTGRADALRNTNAAVRFISAEPLLGPLPSLDLTGIDWLIVGGESGPGSRPLDLGWVRELAAKAQDAGTALFVKQLGSVWARDTSVGGEAVARTDPKGGKWESWPTDLRVREYPAQRVAVTA
ncbi:phage Gp37/Gp68 family protein [Micromonospora sp. NPDC000207]|uniref:DUF5131 family protein n=1 Tax=Micromonospora sp. NPDC000207 TaxID=3154246 RepID=UPI003332EF9D